MDVISAALSGLASNSILGLSHALSVENVLYCAIGVTLGTFLGALPGIGAFVAMSLLFPVTFHLDPTAALIMLGGIFYGTAYGGSISSILLNVPGTPVNAIACLDGYPMAKQGRAAMALMMTAAGSFVGASMGILMMMLFAPAIADYALRFGPAEYFALMAFALVVASSVSDGPAINSFAMVLFGIALSLVGTDLDSSTQRYTFGILDLWDGLSLLSLAMGMFGVTEVISSIRAVQGNLIDRRTITLRAMIPSRQDVKESLGPSLRGAAIGSLIGALPGTGGLIACFMSYATEKKLAKDPSRFGKGALEGVVGPESANNAADQTAFIPTLTLGIPGSPALALILGVLLIHGITPGPTLVREHPEMFWGLVMSFWVGNVLLLILNIPLIGIWVRVLTIPYHLLYPAILFFVCIGVYSVNFSAFEVALVIFFASLGYGMRLLDFPPAPLILGFILGPELEVHFRRALTFNDGDFTAFVARPISATLLGLSALIVAWATWSSFRTKKPGGLAPAAD